MMRLYKSPEEIERMRHAASITSKTFQKIFEFVTPGKTEKQVHGLIVGEFLQQGADMEAYGAIVAGGANACVLHYRDNNQPLIDGELLLIDAGCQFDYYASDVTRTFPIGKKFSPTQKAVYEIVLNAQKAAINEAKPGSTLARMHEAAISVIVDGLIDLKILTQSRNEIIENALFKRYFPHNTSHWIGMDTHDIGDYFVDGKPRALEPGMYFSVEPGLYFDPSDDTVSNEFKGIGIRIEDDVLVTSSGNDILTQSIKKSVADMEGRN
jgi:Xaa-Pro aminopeptidase